MYIIHHFIWLVGFKPLFLAIRKTPLPRGVFKITENHNDLKFELYSKLKETDQKTYLDWFLYIHIRTPIWFSDRIYKIGLFGSNIQINNINRLTQFPG